MNVKCQKYDIRGLLYYMWNDSLFAILPGESKWFDYKISQHSHVCCFYRGCNILQFQNLMITDTWEVRKWSLSIQAKCVVTWGPTTPPGPGGPVFPWKPWRGKKYCWLYRDYAAYCLSSTKQTLSHAESQKMHMWTLIYAYRCHWLFGEDVYPQSFVTVTPTSLSFNLCTRKNWWFAELSKF